MTSVIVQPIPKEKGRDLYQKVGIEKQEKGDLIIFLKTCPNCHNPFECAWPSYTPLCAECTS